MGDLALPASALVERPGPLRRSLHCLWNGLAVTPEEALTMLAEQHRPYIPRVLDVSEDGHGWREATLEDRMASMEWWCDACSRPAARCHAAPILVLAGVRFDD